MKRHKKQLHILFINGSLHGASEQSNTMQLFRYAQAELCRRGAIVSIISPELVAYKQGRKTQEMYMLNSKRVIVAAKSADGFILGTGNYWGQSSSVLQKFIEEATPSESTKAWNGKPIGIIVSEHFTGGQMVLANLMRTFNDFGCVLPPQSGLVFARAVQEASKGGSWSGDTWNFSHIKTMCQNIFDYACNRQKVLPWAVDRNPDEYHKCWTELPKPEQPKSKRHTYVRNGAPKDVERN